jgi:hypothetical protein
LGVVEKAHDVGVPNLGAPGSVSVSQFPEPVLSSEADARA